MSLANVTLPLAASLPPLPEYTLTPRPSIIPGLSDGFFKLIAPPIAYWLFGFFWYLVDRWDLFPQNKIHTPEEELKRNRVDLATVCVNLLKQQGLQIGLGVLTMPQKAKVDFVGKENYDIAVWARRLRYVEQLLPTLLATAGLDSGSMASRLAGSYPYLAGVLRGGDYPWLTQTMMADGIVQTVPAFSEWELLFGKVMYWAVMPVVQLGLAIFFIDLWQYMVHRWMHTNKWLYSRVHSVHHRLYVPFALGALYNHPFEGFLLDTVGALIAQILAGLNIRQAIFFFVLTTVKTVDDHSGYHFSWDPFQMLTPNNTLFHDVHHQSWGIKHNFSQPFLIFWDHYLGTEFTGDTSELYKKSAANAKKAVEEDQAQALANAQAQVS